MAAHKDGPDKQQVKLDELNLSIIKHLREGRKSFKVIAQDLGVTENTVRARVGRLVSDGVLEVTGLIDPEVIPGLKVAIIGINIADRSLIQTSEQLSQLPGVISTSIVTGRFDLILVVLTQGDAGLLQFMTTHLARIEGIKSSETFIVCKGYNVKVPYVL